MAAVILVLAALLAGSLAYGHAGEVHDEMSMPAEYTNLSHPAPGSAAMLAQGQALYAKNCAECHGTLGGDIEEARFNDPAFLDEMADNFLYWRISEGVPGTDMDPWKDKLTPAQRWSLVSYLRALPAVGAALSAAEAGAAEPASPGGASGPAEVAALRARVAALETQVAQLEATAEAPAGGGTPAPARPAAAGSAIFVAGAGLALGILLGLIGGRGREARSAG